MLLGKANNSSNKPSISWLVLSSDDILVSFKRLGDTDTCKRQLDKTNARTIASTIVQLRTKDQFHERHISYFWRATFNRASERLIQPNPCVRT